MYRRVKYREELGARGLESAYFFSGSVVKIGKGERREGLTGVCRLVWPKSDMAGRQRGVAKECVGVEVVKEIGASEQVVVRASGLPVKRLLYAEWTVNGM